MSCILCLLGTGCSELVGITDTEVTAGGVGGDTTSGSVDPPNGNVSGQGGSGQSGSGTGGAPSSGGNAGSSSSSSGGGGGGVNAGGEAGTGEPSDGGCTETTARCTESGREVCTGGTWQSSPCPLNEPTCEGTACVVRGPAMVAVSNFFVDSTEVTEDQYNQFLTAKNGDVSGQPSVCSFNTTYYGEAIALTPGSNLPMANVDWCDARAYCDWAGKRLCGQINGGAIAAADALDQTLSQWFLACGGPNGATHPNPDTNNPDACNSNGGFDNVAPVATFPDCEGFYPGLFDLEGNVAEWVDSCDGVTGAADLCLLLGGNIIDNQSYCTESYDDNQRAATAYTFGFRCCSR